MTFEVLDAKEGLVPKKGEKFGGSDANNQSGHETGTLGDGDEVDIDRGELGSIEGFFDDGDDISDMLA